MRPMPQKLHLLSITFLLTIILFTNPVLAQKFDHYNDGPYIFDKKDSLQLQWVEKGVPYDTIIAKTDAGLFDRPSLPTVNLQDLEFSIDREANYKDIDKVIAVSDVHGKYEILIKLLKAHQVIDDQHKWQFGHGHLVVVGDNFDRGESVLDILWFLFFLQKEAEKAGGKVHMMLGNHEVMVFNGDLRYIHKKYYYTSAAFTTRYDQFFRKGSILGDWIVGHKTMTSINHRLFVHAGISMDFLQLGYSMKKINKIFSKQIIRQPKEKIKNNLELAFLNSRNGPLWYRGYFDKDALNTDSIDIILKKLHQKNIIVGHTSMEKIFSFFDGRVIGIDNGIKRGKAGQVLIMENDKLFIGDIDGNHSKIKPFQKPEKPSVFDLIYSTEGVPTLNLVTDMGLLIRKSHKEEYQATAFSLMDDKGHLVLELPARVRARGEKRKRVCRFPPVKLDFKKSLLDSLGFQTTDKLKLVFPCNDEKHQQIQLYKEFFLYELYGLIDTNGLRTKRIKINIGNEDKKNYEFTGFLIEDEDEYARRKNAQILEKSRINASYMDRESFVRMEFFQYMISNTDWSLRNRHNLELVKLESMDRAIAIAYDFDYAGFVGQDYAVPHESLPIESVHDRYFYNYAISEEEFYDAVIFYLSKEEDIYELCEKAHYMDEATIKENKEYLSGFFDLLRKPKELRKEMKRG